MRRIRILVVEDSQEKLKSIVACLMAVHPIAVDDIADCRDVMEAKRMLSEEYFDLLVVDIALPTRRDSEVVRDGGLRLMAEISVRESYKVPGHVIGMTAYDELLPLATDALAKLTWTVLKYSESEDRWRHQLQAKVVHIILDSQRRLGDRRFEADLAILCALDDPELRSLRQLPDWDWQPLVVPGDATRYYRVRVETGKRVLTAYAASAPRMGMPTASVFATKMIDLFRPQYICMAGIAAGVRGVVNLGDVIVADPSWNYESGKVLGAKGKSIFLPEPHQYHLSPALRESFRSLADREEIPAQIKKCWPGDRLDTDLRIVIGPLASGSSVLADASRLKDIAGQNRKVVAVDMEAYSIFAAADEAIEPKPHAFCIKAICDFADELKNDKHQGYAAFTSAQVLRHFVQAYLP